ncbi:MAG: hypothetical protein ACPIOQ_46095, partial [Promethearchaeia archaeon]
AWLGPLGLGILVAIIVLFVLIMRSPALAQKIGDLGNRLVAMVSGLMLAAATERALLIEWEEYSTPRVHRSKEVSTMVPMDVFFQLPFSCDAAAVLGTVELQRVFGWDYQYWRNLNDEDPADMKVLLSDGIRSAFQERVVTVSAISYFGDLLLANPAAERGGAEARCWLGSKSGADHLCTRRAFYCGPRKRCRTRWTLSISSTWRGGMW